MDKSKASRLALGGILIVQSLSLQAADSYKTMAITLPLLSATKVEFNLRGHGSLGLELNMERESEFYSKKERKEKNGDSLMMKGQQFSLLYSNYGNAKTMAGGYYTIGLGYRRVQADWIETPNASRPTTGLSLDADGRLNHELEATGMTGHARVGYRYVGESVPFLAGIYVGMRHYQATFEDKGGDATAQTASDDLESFQRRLATSLEAGIDIGFSF